jgi:hypothetical protein
MIYFGDFASSSSSGGAVAWNASDKHSDITLSGSDLIATKTTGDTLRSLRATFGRSATDNGYFEVFQTFTFGSGADAAPYRAVGLSNWAVGSADLASYVGDDTSSWSYYQENGNKITNAVQTAYGSTWVSGDTIGCAFNNGKVWFSKNGVWIGDPAAGTGEAFSGLTGTLYPSATLYRASGGGSTQHRVIFRAGSYNCVYTAPTGIGYWER